jgi:hypothetical protein
MLTWILQNELKIQVPQMRSMYNRAALEALRCD